MMDTDTDITDSQRSPLTLQVGGDDSYTQKLFFKNQI